jgi:hypothetical protein
MSLPSLMRLQGAPLQSAISGKWGRCKSIPNPVPIRVAKALYTLDHDGKQAVDHGDELPTGYQSVKG